MGLDFEEDDFYSEENLSKVGETQLNSEVSTSNEDDNETEVVEDEESLAASYSISLKDMGMEDGIEVEDTDDEESMFSPDERLKQFSDSLMASCFGKREISRYAIERLMQLGNPQVFRNENYVLYVVLNQFRGKLRGINIDEEFIRLYLNRNRGILQKARGFVDLNAYGEVDGSVELGYIGGVLKHYKRLLTLPDLNEEEFNTIFEKYIIEYKALESEKIYTQAQIILTDGLTLGRKKYFGFEDSYNYIRRRFAELEGINKNEMGTGFSTARELLSQEKENNKSYKVSDFGRLDALNKILGGIYTGVFYQVIAPPKAGKTKFVSRIVHTTSVVYGNNVTVWAQEGGSEAFLAELRAIHFDYTYNTGVGITEKKFGVDQDAIFHDKIPTDELKQLELSSKLEFISNVNYGSIDFIDRPFNVETFLEDIDTSVKSNHSQVVVIDYLQLIGSETNKSERERVADAYKRLLDYCRKNNVAVITPGQYKQEAFEQIIAKGSTSDAEMRTSAGVSSEVIRTPDIIFALWASTQDLQNNSMKILSVPCRFNKPFPEINVAVDLSCSQFISVE